MVEIVIMNGGKRSIVGSIPVLFIPFSHKELEKKHGDVLSSFLQPLIVELESSFMDGFEVDYAIPSEDICETLDSGKARLRCILMACTGDHPAQCKLGQVKDGGMAFCRCDKAKAELVRDSNGHQRYVYGHNRFQGRYCIEQRHVEDLQKSIKKSKRCPTMEKAEEALRDAGLSRESVLWRLYYAYGFDISKDLVYDVMHVLSLNLFQKYVKKMMLSASPRVKGGVDIAIKKVASSIPKTILHAGRWPNNASKHYKIFKAEECEKFIQWCLPHILNVVDGITKEDTQIGMLLCDIAHMFYDISRQRGWTKEYMDTCRSLLLSWRILSEEYDGANASPLEHVAGKIMTSKDICSCFSNNCLFPFNYALCM